MKNCPLNHENIKLNTKEKINHISLNNPDLKINVIKKNEIAKEDKEKEKEPCKRKRVKMKDGKLDQVAIENNKKY